MKVTVDIAGIKRDLPLCRINDNTYIAAFICFGDAEITEHVAKKMLELIPSSKYDYIFTAEAKGIPIAHEMARQSNAAKYFVARKGKKNYMPDPICVDDRSITTQGLQKLYIGSDDAALIKGKRILLVDDVISTGGSLIAMEELVRLAGGIVTGKIAALAEGNAHLRDDIKYLQRIPLYDKNGNPKE
ncbi:MAG: adenine phosphoribosyltransferase [Clostridiales bacterium]|nr:adenine phosphoribosyltransferase [Clostridiales bacterium]